jgi:hypothetical protein
LAQEEVNREAVALVVKAGKLTGRALAHAMSEALSKMRETYKQEQAPQGRQSVKSLMNHNEATDTIKLDGDAKLFDRAARKFNVDYSVHKTGKDKFTLLFKSKQAGAVTLAMSEFSNIIIKRQKNKENPPIMKRFKKASELAELFNKKRIEHKREAGRDER